MKYLALAIGIIIFKPLHAETFSCSASTAPNVIQGIGDAPIDQKGVGNLNLALKDGYSLKASYITFAAKDKSCRNAHVSFSVFDKKNQRLSETSSTFPCGMMIPEVTVNDVLRNTLSTDVPLGDGQRLSVLCEVTLSPKEKPLIDAINICLGKVQVAALSMAQLSSGGGLPPYRLKEAPKEHTASGPRQKGDKTYFVSVMSSDGYDCDYLVNAQASNGTKCTVHNVEFVMCAK